MATTIDRIPDRIDTGVQRREESSQRTDAKGNSSRQLAWTPRRGT